MSKLGFAALVALVSIDDAATPEVMPVEIQD